MLRNIMTGTSHTAILRATDDALGFDMSDDDTTNNKPHFFPDAVWNALKDDQRTAVIANPRKAYDKLVKSKKIDPAVVLFEPITNGHDSTQGEPDALTTDDNVRPTDEGRENYKFALALAGAVDKELNTHIRESAARSIDDMIDPVRLSFDIRKAWGENVKRLPVVGSKKSNLPAGSNELADYFTLSVYRDNKWSDETVSTYAVMFDRSPYGKELGAEITRYEDSAAGRVMPDDQKVKMPAEQMTSHINRMRSLRTKSINKIKYAAKFVIQQNRIAAMPKVAWEFIAEIDPVTDKVKTYDNGMPMVIGNREMIAVWSTSNLSVRERWSVKKFMGVDVAKALKMPNGGTLAELKSTYTTGKAARGTKKDTGKGTGISIKAETVDQFHDHLAAVLDFLSDPKRYELLIQQLATKPEATEELVMLAGDVAPYIDSLSTKVEGRYKPLNAKRLEKANEQKTAA